MPGTKLLHKCLKYKQLAQLAQTINCGNVLGVKCLKDLQNNNHFHLKVKS